MKKLLLSVLLVSVSLPAFAAEPDPAAGATVSQAEAQPSQGIPLIAQVQERLGALGFYAGPVDGEWNGTTQAALAQFQLANVIPAGGQLDELTLHELGVVREGT